MRQRPLFGQATGTSRPSEAELARLIAEGDRHAGDALSSVFAIGLDMIGDIELPPSAAVQVDRAQMRALGALYLAADLEPAGIISSVETLATLSATGAINVDLGPVAEPLHTFWRARNERPGPTERAAFYGRLFGSSFGSVGADGIANREFETLMLELCEAMYRMDERQMVSSHLDTASNARIRSAARRLLGNLVRAGGGVTPFLAAELMTALKQALAILKHMHLRQVFAARDIWDVVTAIQRQARIRSGDPRVFVERGRAGMTIIVWLAEAAQKLRQYGQPLIAPQDPIILSAVNWLQASLTVSEWQAQAAHPPAPPAADGGLWGNSGNGGSDWSDLRL